MWTQTVVVASKASLRHVHVYRQVLILFLHYTKVTALLNHRTISTLHLVYALVAWGRGGGINNIYRTLVKSPKCYWTMAVIHIRSGH